MLPNLPQPQDPNADPFARIVFPTLPVLNANEVRKTDREKYGALFYLGTGGLLVVLGLLGWFTWQAWGLRDVWTNIYTLHDAQRSVQDRVQAAYTLSRDPRVNPRQRHDNALSKNLPPLGRYLLAESLDAEAASADPRAYGLAVLRSEGWPVWLRLLLTRPMAYAATRGLSVDRLSLEELTRDPDRATSLWATYALAAGPEGNPDSLRALREVARSDTPDHDLAVLLVAALEAGGPAERFKALDTATLWLRTHQPDAARLWTGWRIAGRKIVQVP